MPACQTHRKSKRTSCSAEVIMSMATRCRRANDDEHSYAWIGEVRPMVSNCTKHPRKGGHNEILNTADWIFQSKRSQGRHGTRLCFADRRFVHIADDRTKR